MELNEVWINKLFFHYIQKLLDSVNVLLYFIENNVPNSNAISSQSEYKKGQLWEFQGPTSLGLKFF